MTEDEMVGWHHPHKGHEFEQTLGDGGRQESLMCCTHGVRKRQTQVGAEQQQEVSLW